MRRAVVLIALLVASSVTPDEARACSPARWPDNGRYVGGDLATQIAAKADTIQLVRVRERHLLSRIDNRVEYFQRVGRWPDERDIGVPRARYRQVYLYLFDVVESLKGRDIFDHRYAGDPIRITAYAAEEADEPGARWWASQPWVSESLLSAPGISHMNALPVPQPAEGLDTCQPRVLLELGAYYLVLRDRTGRVYFRHEFGALYNNEDDGGLSVTVAVGQSTPFTIDAPPIAHVSGADDPYVTALRAAVARGSRE